MSEFLFTSYIYQQAPEMWKTTYIYTIVVNFQNGVCQYLSKPDFSLHQHILFKDEIIECKRWNILSRVWVLLSTFKLRSEWLLLKCQLSNFSALSWGNQVNFPWDENEVGFVLDQHTLLDFFSASLLIQQSAPLKTHYHDNEPTSLCSFSLMLHA